ncbi:divergent polysaccharide deacteylase family protein [Ruegeria halocynthiae]|uniref:divergent polysaccharide deacteylase family protein n=1 Tax=Ruegeria halocynthiae TaxID=985054 RepID=UPI001FDFE1B3|nr:divergent polysaccharide deacetylase family protein [Ruegeria halocynthiae]
MQVSATEDGTRAIEARNNARGEISMGGFYGGLIAGAVSVLALGAILSLSTPLSRKPEVAATAPEVADAPEQVQTAQVGEAGVDADLLELPPAGPESPAQSSDSLDSLADIETDPGAPPAAGQTPTDTEAPVSVSSPAVAVQTDAPTAPPAPPATPETPQQEAEPAILADAPSPSEPVEEPEPQVVEETPEETAPQVAALQPRPELLPDVAPEAPDAETEPERNPIAVEGEENTRPVRQPRVLTLPQIDGDGATSSGTLVGKRVIPLTERDDPIAEEPGLVTTTVSKPIEEHAATFENTESKPLMSIILIDDVGAFGAEALQDFPYPLSFAVSPSDPQAAEKMARHREAGFEVLALIDLHEAASAQDAEVSLSVWLDELPQTVGILEGVESGIQGNRKLADQVAAIAGDTGRGLVTQDNGLNTVQKLAARNGVPSSVVFRDFDGAKQDPKIMRRFLDQAAFRAGQEGAVVMLGRLRPETISALLLWGLEDRGNRVAMAPISAVMMQEVQQDDSGS